MPKHFLFIQSHIKPFVHQLSREKRSKYSKVWSRNAVQVSITKNFLQQRLSAEEWRVWTTLIVYLCCVSQPTLSLLCITKQNTSWHPIAVVYHIHVHIHISTPQHVSVLTYLCSMHIHVSTCIWNMFINPCIANYIYIFSLLILLSIWSGKIFSIQ